MTTTECYGTHWVCIDCLFLLANGETPPEMNEEETEAWLKEIERRTEGCSVTLGLRFEEHDCEEPGDGYCECEQKEFSWSRCPHCGSPLGGAREATTWWEKTCQ